MKKIVFGMLAMAGLLTGACTADDQATQGQGNVQLEGGTGGTGGGNGTIPPPPPPPPYR